MRIGTVIVLLAALFFLSGVVVSKGPAYYRQIGKERATQIYQPQLDFVKGMLAETEWERDVARGIARDNREKLDSTQRQLQLARKENDALTTEIGRLRQDSVVLALDTARLRDSLQSAADSIRDLQDRMADSALLLQQMREDACEKEILLSNQILRIDTLQSQADHLRSLAARTESAEKRARTDRFTTSLLALAIIGWLVYRWLHANHFPPKRRRKKTSVEERSSPRAAPEKRQMETQAPFTPSQPLEPSIFFSRPLASHQMRRFL